MIFRKQFAVLAATVFALSMASACSNNEKTTLSSQDSGVQEPSENSCPKPAVVNKIPDGKQATTITKENYALAETDIVMSEYVKKIGQKNCSTGIGEFLHIRDAMDISDRTIIRPNFDTLYSAAVLDLSTPAVIVMPETNRLQILAAVNDVHWNVLLTDKPGRYELTEESAGSKYVYLIVRTQVNMRDQVDLKKVAALQDQIKIEQDDKGAYVQTNHWDPDQIRVLRDEYNERWIAEGIKSEMAFGGKGEISPEMRNFGVAYGWGGLPKKGAVYPTLQVPSSGKAFTLTLKDVPMGDNAFWSVTIYDQDGFSRGENYNINSSFAKANSDGEYVLNFGTTPGEENYLETFDGWNATLRIYSPTAEYFNGAWTVPSLEVVQ